MKVKDKRGEKANSEAKMPFAGVTWVVSAMDNTPLQPTRASHCYTGARLRKECVHVPLTLVLVDPAETAKKPEAMVEMLSSESLR